eukprot:m.164130 g.164130  ORF g.164130 m.164130 type:complete len:135 (+) comp38868_c0_seq8:3627-4031(+)
MHEDSFSSSSESEGEKARLAEAAYEAGFLLRDGIQRKLRVSKRPGVGKTSDEQDLHLKQHLAQKLAGHFDSLLEYYDLPSSKAQNSDDLKDEEFIPSCRLLSSSQTPLQAQLTSSAQARKRPLSRHNTSRSSSR